jgi:glycolate oxidase FAD binding subunit
MSVTASLVESLRSEVEVVEEPGAWPGLAGTPEAVAHPSTTEEVAATMRWAGSHGVGVVVLASGSRFLGARRLDRPFLVMRMDRMSGIDIYDPADLTLTAKAGTPLRVVARELGANRQWLPYDPPQADARSLGGLVATGESGPLWMGYGELRNHVLGATLVTGDGRTLELGGRVVKNVAGFDLLKPVVGSRGRLGVITSVCVRAFPVPVSDRVLVLRAESIQALLPAARAIGSASVMPVSSVLLGGPGPGRARLLVRLHGAEATVEADQKTLESHCSVTFERAPAAGADDARDHATAGDVVFLVSVLPSRLGEALTAIGELAENPAIHVDTYRGSFRVAVGSDEARRASKLRARIEALGGALGARVARGVDLDVSVSSVSPPAAALTKGLEDVFDPGGVLWPSR